MTCFFPYFVNNSSYLLKFVERKLPFSSYIFTKFARIAILPFESRNLTLYPFIPLSLISVTNFAVFTLSRFKCICQVLFSLPIVIHLSFLRIGNYFSGLTSKFYFHLLTDTKVNHMYYIRTGNPLSGLTSQIPLPLFTDNIISSMSSKSETSLLMRSRDNCEYYLPSSIKI